MNRMTSSTLLKVLLIALILSACGRSPQPLTLKMLKKTEYHSDWSASGKIKLTDGIYKEKVAPGSATELVITLSDHFAIGDLNADDAADAAVVLISNPGGSGTFRDLAVVVNQNGRPQHIATELLGDRIKVKSVTIKLGEIVVEMLKQGPSDPMIRPTLNVTQIYRLQGDKLVRADPHNEK